MMHAIALNRRLQAGEAVNVVLDAGDLRVELAVASARLEPIYGPRFDRSAQVEQAIRFEHCL